MSSGSSERHARVKEIFLAACEREPEQWPEYLDRACGSDPELRDEVESLLGFHGESVAARADPPAAREGTVERDPIETAALLERFLDRAHADVLGETLSERYEIHRELGSGGMGRVYLATDRRFGKSVALKSMH